MKDVFKLVLLAGLVGGVAEAAPQQNLITDGSFEQPLVAKGTYVLFDLGKTLSKWAVTGEPGNVAIVSGTFSQSGLTFPAQNGQQWLDLTGTSNTPTGVQQTVTTKPGSVYRLTFWVGNVFNPGGIFGASSKIDVFLNYQLSTSAINTDGKGKSTQVWKQFSVEFTATASSTTITFINADPGFDNSNGLDNVSLEFVR